jgi:hypothetical protein
MDGGGDPCGPDVLTKDNSTVTYCVSAQFKCASFAFVCGGNAHPPTPGVGAGSCKGGLLFKATYTCPDLTQVVVQGGDCYGGSQEVATCPFP